MSSDNEWLALNLTGIKEIHLGALANWTATRRDARVLWRFIDIKKIKYLQPEELKGWCRSCNSNAWTELFRFQRTEISASERSSTVSVQKLSLSD